jgi:ABC-2 type transport system ATP-binding protein
VIRIENITKDYGERRAVNDISFNVEKGEIVGFLGPNGAGKTTTMRILTGFLMPTSGDAWIADHNMATDSLAGRRLIGYLPEIVPLYTDMTTRAYLDFAGRIRGLDKKTCRKRVEEVVERCGLEEYVDVLLRKLSKGYRQRVGLAQAIVHDPEVLILDEPTIGIDPIQISQIRQLITDLGENRTILLSTHILPEVGMTCERVIIINQGKIVAKDRIENLSSLLKGGKQLRLKVQGPPESVKSSLEKIDAIEKVSYEEPFHMIEFATESEPQNEINQNLMSNGWTLLSMESVDMSLEDIFLQVTSVEEEAVEQEEATR